MTSDDGYAAFLHIVHISDMHVNDQAGSTDLTTERRIQRLAALARVASRKLAEFIEEYWEQGKAGHDARALRLFPEFLQEFADDPGFNGIDTWLVDTGDLSSLGNDASILSAKKSLARYQHILSASNTIMLRGNHDSWPGKFPALASDEELAKHKAALANLFPFTLPQKPLRKRIPGTNSELQLFAIDSAIHDSGYNTFALGSVGDERHWADQGESDSQLAHLAEIAQEFANPVGEERHFRILAIHHPVHYPPPKPLVWMKLMGANKVADALITFDAKKLGKLAHVVLSGHTHEPFPRPGTLPDVATSVTHTPLTAGQLQFVCGSLCQTVRENDRRKSSADRFVPHQCQILTFWAAPEKPGAVLIERRIVGRIGGVGRYGYIECGDPPKTVESTLVEF